VSVGRRKAKKGKCIEGKEVEILENGRRQE
jgi:hypothetical protein